MRKNFALLFLILPVLNGCKSDNEVVDTAPPPSEVTPPSEDYCDASERHIAYRFLEQASIAAKTEDVDTVMEVGICRWLEEQLSLANDVSNTEATIRIAQSTDRGASYYENNGEFNNKNDSGFPGGSFDVLAYRSLAWWENQINSRGASKTEGCACTQSTFGCIGYRGPA